MLHDEQDKENKWWYIKHNLRIVLVCCCCCNNLWQLSWHSTTRIDYFTVPSARVQYRSHWENEGVSRLLPFPQGLREKLYIFIWVFGRIRFFEALDQHLHSLAGSKLRDHFHLLEPTHLLVHGHLLPSTRSATLLLELHLCDPLLHSPSPFKDMCD